MRTLYATIIGAMLATNAYAGPVAVDFSALPSTIDITTPNNVSLNGVTFSYNQPTNYLDVHATADSTGIHGDPNYGVLTMMFAAPATSLSFSYSNGSSTLSGAIDHTLYERLVDPQGHSHRISNNPLLVQIGQSDGSIVQNTVVTTAGNYNDPATFDYTGSAFTEAWVIFAFTADVFTIDTIAYTPAPAPEPMSLLLLGSGLCGLGLFRRKLI